MHELSIALAIVELAATRARAGNLSVAAVHVRIGPLSGVVPEALTFAFDLATAGTPIEGASLRIQTEPVVAWCATCAEARELDDVQHRRCSVCGEFAASIQSGDSLELVALEVADGVAAHR